MDIETYLKTIEIFSNRMFTVAEGKDSEVIKECPDWSVNDLMAHVGIVYGWVTSIIESGSLERPTTPFPTPPENNQREWAMNRLSTLLKIVRESDPMTPVWTFGKDKNVGFFIRRMTHETLIHMRDAESVIDEFIEVDGDVACDGIDEYIDGALQRSINPNREFRYPDGSIHLHRTDGEGEWLLESHEDGLVVRREHAKGAVAVRGKAMSLLLFIWGRNPDGLEIFGEADIAQEWAQLAP